MNKNIQDALLLEARTRKIKVNIFLMNGVKLYGIITNFDNYVIVLQKDGLSQMVYKHAVSTVSPEIGLSWGGI